MLRGILERVAVVLTLVLGQGADDPVAVLIAAVLVLALGTGGEIVTQRRSVQAATTAVLRAAALSPGSKPCDDAQLLLALRRAGIKPEVVAEAWAREQTGD